MQQTRSALFTDGAALAADLGVRQTKSGSQPTAVRGARLQQGGEYRDRIAQDTVVILTDGFED